MIVSVPHRPLPSRTEDVAYLYCPGGYPAFPKEMRLQELRCIRYLGLSSHCIYPSVAPLAVGLGANMLEYHFMLTNEPSELEENVSLNEFEFGCMVQSVREAEALLGD